MKKSESKRIADYMVRVGENPRIARALAKDKKLIGLAKARGSKTPKEIAKDIKSFKAFKSTRRYA